MWDYLLNCITGKQLPMLIILFYDPLIIKIPNTRTYQILIYTQQNYYRGNFSDSLWY